MDDKFHIKMLVFTNGERYSILINSQGKPHALSTIYATLQLRNSNKASNTIVAFSIAADLFKLVLPLLPEF